MAASDSRAAEFDAPSHPGWITEESHTRSTATAIHHPPFHLSPIIRGKTRASVKFGAKISVSVRNGFAFLRRISRDAYNNPRN